jgi:diguanylate cyclase (GGDEF)-like protein
MASMSHLTTAERSRRVLVIEDSEPDRRILKRRLGDDQIEVVEAGDGMNGLARCRADPPDLILLDLGLPGHDGFEILRQLKESSDTAAIPVIVVSGAAESSDRVRSLDLGAVDFVAKPYDTDELRARIRVALRTLRLQELLERRALVDGLTGLANRGALEDRLVAEWAMYQRHGTPLAVMMADLDQFKQVNDRYGHLVGDDVLRRAASVLRASVRAGDLAARYGGEEFAVVAPHCNTEGALRSAERFRQRLAEPAVILGPADLGVTASIGVASVPEDPAGSPGDLLSLADEALYLAKSRGRNRVLSTADRPGGRAGTHRPLARF